MSFALVLRLCLTGATVFGLYNGEGHASPANEALIFAASKSPTNKAPAKETDRYAPPTNYRTLIVQFPKQDRNADQVRRALISRPYEEWLGIFQGGTRQAVCVEVYRETILFSDARDIWIFSFKDGQIDGAGYAYPGPGCKDLVPLSEIIVKAKAN